MKSQEVTSVDDGSAVGVAYRPTFKTFAGLGPLVKDLTTKFPQGTLLAVKKTAASLEIRRLTDADRTAALVVIGDAFDGDGLVKITGVVSSGRRYEWTFTENSGTDVLVVPDANGSPDGSPYNLENLINAICDGAFYTELNSAGFTHSTFDTNDWLLVDPTTAAIYYGPGDYGTEDIETVILAAVPDAELTATDQPDGSGWSG